jgi:hypothetical protein
VTVPLYLVVGQNIPHERQPSLKVACVAKVARMLALTLLGVLVAADSNGGVTASIFTTGLPERVLQDLAETPPQAFFQVNLLTLPFTIIAVT